MNQFLHMFYYSQILGDPYLQQNNLLDSDIHLVKKSIKEIR